ncbi:response regulator transcription factor [Neobacillus sp. WH10]|uniref:response regulator transcription factor n=1 Tax=Neobacillus sp. WH10 TaxID=3047873 RepID=UPI0024C164F9|nr:response regulator transcription factor [Neobacillus sp. WH10]WHY79758.1 response regulator transcription factor [Neobacillus sp. WH10]
MRLLIVDDELFIAEAVAHVLKKHNYSVDIAKDGEEGLDCGLSDIYDIIILDIMLPKIDGIEVLKELRQSGIQTPVILLTAKGDIDDKVRGLDCGADDYLAKPFNTDELLARLRALGRRKTELIQDGILTFEDLEFHSNLLLLRSKEQETKLTLKESQLLELLFYRKNTVSSKEVIIEKLWGYDSDADYSHVEVQISFLRKKLKQLPTEVSIENIRGAGYRLKFGKVKR